VPEPRFSLAPVRLLATPAWTMHLSYIDLQRYGNGFPYIGRAVNLLQHKRC
jgi:hypothetical protein